MDLDRFHPTQKPIYVYDFCFVYSKAQKGMRVIDTHLGSGNSRISADKYGLDFVGFEIDKEYYDKSEKKFAMYRSQPRLADW